MNACVRAVVRQAASDGHEVIGIRRGYQGLLDQSFYLDADRDWTNGRFPVGRALAVPFSAAVTVTRFGRRKDSKKRLGYSTSNRLRA